MCGILCDSPQNRKIYFLTGKNVFFTNIGSEYFPLWRGLRHKYAFVAQVVFGVRDGVFYGLSAGRCVVMMWVPDEIFCTPLVSDSGEHKEATPFTVISHAPPKRCSAHGLGRADPWRHRVRGRPPPYPHIRVRHSPFPVDRVSWDHVREHVKIGDDGVRPVPTASTAARSACWSRASNPLVPRRYVPAGPVP